MYTLYQSPVSYYSGKTRAYLNYKNLPFEQVMASDKVAKEVIKPATKGLRIIPVVKTPEGKYIQDSSVIMDELELRHPEPSIEPLGAKQRLVSSLFELYGDEWLLLPAMHYRWGFKRDNLAFILKNFGATRQPHWPAFLQPLAGVAPALLFGNVPVLMLGINKRNRQALEAWTLALIDLLDAHFKEYPYLLGGRACAGDFGLFGPFYAHLYLDPYPGKILRSRAPHLCQWIERMAQSSAKPIKIGNWLADDVIPETLSPILQLQLRDQLPVLREVVARVERYAQQQNSNTSEVKLKRFMGRQPYAIDGIASRRFVTPYSQWMLQRALLPLFDLTGEQYQGVVDWLEHHKLEVWLTLKPKHLVQWRDSRLYLQLK